MELCRHCGRGIERFGYGAGAGYLHSMGEDDLGCDRPAPPPYDDPEAAAFFAVEGRRTPTPRPPRRYCCPRAGCDATAEGDRPLSVVTQRARPAP